MKTHILKYVQVDISVSEYPAKISKTQSASFYVNNKKVQKQRPVRRLEAQKNLKKTNGLLPKNKQPEMQPNKAHLGHDPVAKPKTISIECFTYLTSKA